MKHVLDLGPAVAFFVAYYLGDIYTATLTVIIALFVTVALSVLKIWIGAGV